MPAAIQNLEFPKGLNGRLAELNHARSQLLQEIQAATTVSVAPSRSNAWSIAEVVYHLHLSEKSIARMLKKALDSTAPHAVVDNEQLRAEWERIHTLIGTRRAKAQAPPRTVPANAPDLADGVELLRQSRQQLLDVVQNTTYDHLLSVSAPHPFQFIGTVTGTGWLSVVACHELRHAEQIRELSAANKSHGVQPTEA